MGNFEKYFTIIDIKVKEFVPGYVTQITIICKKRMFVTPQKFSKEVQNLGEKMLEDNKGKGRCYVGWASHNLKYIELKMYLEYSPPINKVRIGSMNTMCPGAKHTQDIF